MATYSKLLNIQDNNHPSIVTLLPEDKIYNVDLNTRKIETIDNIIVKTDHKSEVLYFKVPRFYDNIDLFQMTCIIEYVNSKHEQYIYVVPFIDIDTLSEEKSEEGFRNPMMIIPWEISELVSVEEGEVRFAINFYRMGLDGEKYTYNLNTLPQSLYINKGIGFTREEIVPEEEWVETLDTTPNASKQYFIKKVNYLTIYDKNIFDILQGYVQVYNEETGLPEYDHDEIGRILDSNKNPIIKSSEFIPAYGLLHFDPEVTYFEKVEKYKYGSDYLKYIQQAAKAVKEGSLTWIVLD